MLYKEKFNLTGTEQQQQIVKDALDAIKFPFEKITPRFGTAEIGWANLNGQSNQTGLPNNQQVQTEAVKAVMSEAKPLTKDDITAYPEDVAKVDHSVATEPRHHDAGHEGEGDPNYHEPLMGRLEGRNYVLGVFYPYNGSIFVDNYLVDYPHYAQTTVSAEIAHSVDEFLPLTDGQRDEIMKLVNGGDDTGLTWWEKVDYNAEYYTLIGETFMILFTYAYSDLGFEGADDFKYHGDPTMGDEVRAIIGIERTDTPVSIPVPEPTPVETTPEPTPSEPVPVEPAPVPEPTPDTEGGSQTQPNTNPDSGGGDSGTTTGTDTFVKYGKSKIYHLPTHYKNKPNAVTITDLEGMRLCKICQKAIDKTKKSV